MAAEKRYTNGIFIKSVKTKFGSLLNVSISDSALKELQAELNPKGYVNLTIAERKEADKYGNTHYAFYNDYTKSEEVKKPLPSGRSYTQPETETNDDLPF